MKISGLKITEWLCVFVACLIILGMVFIYGIIKLLALARIPYFRQLADEIDSMFDDPYGE